MAIEAIVFDLGNVLIRYQESQLLAAMAGTVGGDADRARLFFESIRNDLYAGKLALPDVHRLLREQHGFAGELEPFQVAFSSCLSRDQPAVEHMLKLRQATCLKMAVISNICDGHDRWVRGNLPEIMDFDVIIFSNEVRLFKPEPGIYRLTSERLGLQPQQLIFIDDLKENAAAASTLGWHGIHHRDWVETYPRILEIIERQHGR